MIMMQGNDRIFDKVVIEGGTAAARTISLYGVTDLSELQGVSLIVRANIGGSNSATTMKVNDLTATKLSVFKNGGIADADADWIVSGQLYMLYYDGVQFIAFPMSASSGSSNSSVEFADFPIDVLNLNAQSSETDISSAFGGAAKTAEFDALVQAGTKIIRFTNVDSFVYYMAIYYKQINVENSAVNDIVVVLHNYTDRTDLEMFTFVGTMTEDGDFEKYTAVAKRTLYSSNQEGTLNNPRAFTGDANTKTTPGVYAITPFSNVPSNIPSGVSYGTMIVTTDEDASTITQTLQTSNTVYFRCKYSTNAWGEWVDLGASGGSTTEGMKTFEIDHGDLANMRNADSESDILAIWDDTKQSEFVEAMDDPDTIIVIKYTDDQYITSRDYIVCKTGFYGGIGYSQYGQTQYISFTYLTGLYLYSYTFHFNFETDHISSVTRSFIDLSEIEDEMIIETDQATSLSFDNQTGNRGILAVSGNQKQETREGYNMLQNNLQNTVFSGVTFTINEDKSVTVNGTATTNIVANLTTGEITESENGDLSEEHFIIPDDVSTLRLTGCPNGGSSSTYKVDLYNTNYSAIMTDWGAGTTKTGLVDNDRKVNRARIVIYSGTTLDNLTFKPMLVAGTEEKEYEQYGTSPSLDYPSPVKCLGSNKNLLNTSLMIETTKGGVTSKINSDGSITFNGTCTTNNNVFDFYIENTTKFTFDAIKDQTTISAFYVSGSITDSNDSGAYFRVNDKSYNGGYINLVNLPQQKQLTRIYNSTSGSIFCDIRFNSGVVLDNFTIKCKAANTLEDAFTYSPYGQGSTNIKVLQYEKEYVNKTLPIQQEMLRGNSFTRYDYFVKEADGWKEVHNYPKKIFDGTEAWNLESLSQGNNFYTNIPDALGDTTAPVYSNCFMYYNGLLDENYSCRISGSKNLNLRCNEKNTVEEFKQMLADKYNTGNPVYAFYKSATPIKIPCTEEQSKVLDELNNLTMEFGVNNIITAEDIALLQMTLVDSYLNNVIEASIPIVNSDSIVLSSTVLDLTSDSTRDEITAAFGGLENEEKVLRELSAGNKSLKIATEYNGNTCGAVEAIWYEVGPVANDFNFIYIMNGYLVYKGIHCDSGPRSLGYNDQFYPLSQVYHIERVKLYGTASNPEELSYTEDFNSIITPGIYKADQSEGRMNAPCINPGTLIVGASEGEYRGNARDNCIIQFYIASHCRLDETDYSSGIYFRSYAFDGIKNTQYWTDWVNLLDKGSEIGTILNPNVLTSTNNLNDVKTSGIYSYTTSSTPINAPSGTSYGTLMVNKISDKEITQTIISPDFSEGSSSKSSNIWFRNYGTRSSNQQSGVPEWSDWSLLLMSDYGNKYRYIKPYLLSYYKFDSLNSDSTQTDIENAFGSLEDEQEFIAAMNDENTNIILYYDHESNEREYWYTISKMVDNGKYHRLVLCRGNSSENMTAGSISFIIYSFKYDETNNVYTAFNREQIGVPSKGTIINANGLYSGSTDMNSLYEPGVSNIRADSSLQNYPAGAGTGTLLVFKISNMYLIQILITSTYLEASNPIKVYSRGCQTNLDGVPSDDTWSEWQEWSLANTAYSNATTTADGLMSKEDKTKLNGIATGATANSASTTTPKANGTAAVGTDTKFARGDHVHPAQTTITGNAGSATKLQNARTINGVSFDGTKNIIIPVPDLIEATSESDALSKSKSNPNNIYYWTE